MHIRDVGACAAAETAVKLFLTFNQRKLYLFPSPLIKRIGNAAVLIVNLILNLYCIDVAGPSKNEQIPRVLKLALPEFIIGKVWVIGVITSFIA